MTKTPATDPTLQNSRIKIDSLDKKLIALLGERERVVKEIGIYKAKNNIPSLQADRFKQVLEKNIEAGKQQGLSATFIIELMNAIHNESLRIEEEIKAQSNNACKKYTINSTHFNGSKPKDNCAIKKLQ